MMNDATTTEERNSFLRTAHEVLTGNGFRPHGGGKRAPRTSKDNMAYIYQHPISKHYELWLCSNRRFRLYDKRLDKFHHMIYWSNRISDLVEIARRFADDYAARNAS